MASLANDRKLRVVGTHEEYKEMTAAHALEAHEPAEARELEVHLATCAKCRAEAESWRNTAASLAYAAPDATPSVELRSRIFASIRADGMQQVARSTVKDGERVESHAVEASQSESKVVRFEKPSRRRGAAVSLIALAASVAFIALAISLVLVWNRYNAMRWELVQLTDRLDQAQSELASGRETLARERRARELISAPEASVATLAGTELAARARARFVIDRTTGRAMLMAYDLPPAPTGKAYQIWYIAEGKPPMPGHVFNTDAAGHAEMLDQLSEEARGATTFAVTLEPANGVPAPTGPKYLLGTTS